MNTKYQAAGRPGSEAPSRPGPRVNTYPPPPLAIARHLKETGMLKPELCAAKSE